MIEVYLRPIYQLFLLNHIAKGIKTVNPIKITLLACLSGILVAPLLLFHLPKLATLFLLISGFLDTLDGAVARERGVSSNSGTVLDIVSDRMVEFAVIFGLYIYDPANRGALILLMLGSCYICITCFLVVGVFTANHSQKGFFYSKGLIERAEAFVFFIMMIWLPHYFSLLALLFVALVFLTSYLHIKEFLHGEYRRKRKFHFR